MDLGSEDLQTKQKQWLAKNMSPAKKRMLKKRRSEYQIQRYHFRWIKIQNRSELLNHPTKSHVVLIKDDGKDRLIRFGQQGAKTAGKPKKGESQGDEDKA